MTKKKNKVKQNWSRFSLVLMAVVISLAIAGITKAWTLTGNADEYSLFFGSSNSGGNFGTIIPDTEVNFTGTSVDIDGTLNVDGATTLVDTLTLTGDFIGENLINYTDIDSDAGKIGWITCNSDATSTVGTNPCEYTHTGDDIFVVAVGAIVSSGAASDTALLDVGYSADATNTVVENIFDELDVGCAGGTTCAFVVDTTSHTATACASAFQGFKMIAGDSIVATQAGQGGVTGDDMGDIEESVFKLYYRYFQIP